MVATAHAAAHPACGVVNIDQPLQLAQFQGALRQVEPMLRGDQASFDAVLAATSDGMYGPLSEAERMRIIALRRADQQVVLAIWPSSSRAARRSRPAARGRASLRRADTADCCRPGRGLGHGADRSGADRSGADRSGADRSDADRSDGAGGRCAVLCKCGHQRAAHRHYRAGSDCALCECQRWSVSWSSWLRRLIPTRPR